MPVLLAEETERTEEGARGREENGSAGDGSRYLKRIVRISG